MRPPIRVWALLASLVCLSGSTPFTQLISARSGAQPAPPNLTALQAEFPQYDQQVWAAERRGLMIRAGLAHLAREPYAGDGIDALVQLGRIDDAFAVVAQAVQAAPLRMNEAFEALMRDSTSFINDGARDYRTRLHERAVAARTRLPDLPREEAAHFARQLIDIDGPQSTPRGTERADALRAFIVRSRASRNGRRRQGLVREGIATADQQQPVGP